MKVSMGSLSQRLAASQGVALEVALQALGVQAGQPTVVDPALAALEVGFYLTEGVTKGVGSAGEVDWAGALDPRECLDGRPLPLLSARAVCQTLAGLPRLHGTEHHAWFLAGPNLAVKATWPGQHGAEKLGLRGYAQRLAWSNELFADAWRFLGQVQLPGEVGPRVLTTQPWYRTHPTPGPHPSQEEIDHVMRAHGFLKAYDGAYLHEFRDLVASDALPKNFLRDAAGYVHPVDVILIPPTDRQQERLMNMVNSQPQVAR
ncbi:hypothetical protein [Prosthecobacter dejongeii]|uniref:Uncharacterized protein n=1 Tax=Prosthecobacter dejongeii TaxID=48465 RepID=A0A7W7YJM2_9BACT|nr:hypothetical protein [Prosthecobacter dejongeii]MBB5037418.1 hypothetical protein [Prosthecobacter dejongeii]